MIRENGVGQIIEVGMTRVAPVALPVTLALMDAAFPDIVGFTPGAFDSIGPTKPANGFIAFRVIDQGVNSEHLGSMPRSNSLSKNLKTGSDRFSSQKQL